MRRGSISSHLRIEPGYYRESVIQLRRRRKVCRKTLHRSGHNTAVERQDRAEVVTHELAQRLGIVFIDVDRIPKKNPLYTLCARRRSEGAL